MTRLRILNWGHRRATDPLQAAVAAYRERRPDVDFELVVRPLSDFEHQGIAGAALEHDLVVYDHPFSGDIAAAGVFLPLEERLAGWLGDGRDARYVGPSLASYRFAGHVWGVPIDGATQHALVRRDLLAAAGESVPRNWRDAVALGERLAPRGLKLGMAVETPHALLTLGSLMANAGTPWGTDPDAPMVIDPAGLGEAFDRLRRLLALCPPEALGWNSIDLHEAMVSRDDIVYCPCVYGYATYGEADLRRRLSFAPFAGTVAPWQAGSAVGGTAIAVSRHCAAPDAALDFVAFLLEDKVQDALIPGHHGQPATATAWDDVGNDDRFNGYYSAVRSSMDSAWVRPRHAGYPVFQREAGTVAAAALRGEMDDNAAIDRILTLARRVGTAPPTGS